MRILFFIALTFIALPLGMANKMSDSFGVRRIGAEEAVVAGEIKDLKPGDSLYFVRPPYEFKVKSVDKDLGEVTVSLPGAHDLKQGNALLRNPTPRILKSIKTEARLKEALND